MDKGKEDDRQQVKVFIEPSKAVPKLVTKIGMAKTSSGNVVITFFLELPGEQTQLVERIVIDTPTSKEFAELLDGVNKSE